MQTATGTSPSDRTWLQEVESSPSDPRIFPSDFTNPTARALFTAGHAKQASRCEDCGKFFCYEDCGIHNVKLIRRCNSRFLCDYCASFASEFYIKRYSRLSPHIGQFTYGEISKPCQDNERAIRRALNSLSRLLRSHKPHAWILFTPRWHEGSIQIRYLHYGPHEPTAAIRLRWTDATVRADLYLPQHLPNILASLFRKSIAPAPSARVEQFRIFGKARQLRHGGNLMSSYLSTESTQTTNSTSNDSDGPDIRPKCRCCSRKVQRRSEDIHISTIITDRKQIHWRILRRI
jgi:hypothetical protein